MTLDLGRNETPPWGGYDFRKKSLVVIACNEHGDGVVLWTVGAHVRMEMEEVGLKTVEELGLEPPTAGIWIWEGRYVFVPGNYECPEDSSMDPVGEHRAPTEQEWARIRSGHCPWNSADWILPEYREELAREREAVS